MVEMRQSISRLDRVVQGLVRHSGCCYCVPLLLKKAPLFTCEIGLVLVAASPTWS